MDPAEKRNVAEQLAGRQSGARLRRLERRPIDGRAIAKDVPLATQPKNSEAYPMTNLLQQAINGDRAAKLIQDALGIESDDVNGPPTASSALGTSASG